MTPRFKPGDRVKVRVGSPPGHFRTPAYIQGKVGSVERVQGAYKNPETLAHGGDGLPKRFLYLVRFDQRKLWERYPGQPGDTLSMDLFEHWLEAA